MMHQQLIRRYAIDVVNSLENEFCVWYAYLKDSSGGVISDILFRAKENV
jgi:hypothetical protein